MLQIDESSVIPHFSSAFRHHEAQKSQRCATMMNQGKPLCASLLMFLALLTLGTVQSFPLITLPFLNDMTSATHRPAKNHARQRAVVALQLTPDDDTKQEQQKTDPTSTDIISRFTSPKIDDPYLPLVDVSIAQIVAPTLQIAWLSLNHAPSPTWLRPVFDTLYQTRGSLVAPTLIHGAGLASCWVFGALAAKAYERDAIVPSSGQDYARILARICQAGAFATGILIFATQIDLFLEFGMHYVQPGESPETDFRLLTAAVELINDVFFEAISLITWRLFLAKQNSSSQ